MSNITAGEKVILRNLSICNALKVEDEILIDYINSIKSNQNLSFETIFIVIFYALLTAIMSFFCKYYTKKVLGEVETVHTTFTAGGQLSAGLIMTNLVSQWTWAATLLQSSTVGVIYGLSGTLWYASGASIQLIIFSIVSVMLKIRAPGAITVLQVIHARFGRKAHIVFCIFALLTNLIVISMLLLGGSSVLTKITRNLSFEMCTVLMMFVIAISSLSGNLACTYYISYFTTAALLISIMALSFSFFYMPKNEVDGSLSQSFENIYQLVWCRLALKITKNFDDSYLTLLSSNGLKFGIINIIGNFATVFVDQTYWAASVAAKPREGVIGFILGGMVWFAIPFSFSTTCSLFYLSFGTRLGNDFLTLSQVSEGLVPNVIATFFFGYVGQIILVAMIVIAVSTTACSEVYAVTSIIVFDIYAIYIKPYKSYQNRNTYMCILCGKYRGPKSDTIEKCNCISMSACGHCIGDDRERRNSQKIIKPNYNCQMHGAYRSYLDYLEHLKQWCMVLVIISMLPFTLILNLTGVTLGWMYQFMGVLVGSAVGPVSYALILNKITGWSVIIGSIGGTIIGLATLLIYAFSYDPKQDFYTNSNVVSVMLAGNCVSIGIGLVLPIIFSSISNRVNRKDFKEKDQNIDEWERTRAIDNPLVPWAEVYANEMKLDNASELRKGRPTLEVVTNRYKIWITISITSAIVLVILYIIIWPGFGCIGLNFTYNSFQAWIYFMHVYLVSAVLLCLLFPLLGEWKKLREFINNNTIGRKKLQIINSIFKNPTQTDHNKVFVPFDFNAPDSSEYYENMAHRENSNENISVITEEN